jgi:timeless
MLHRIAFDQRLPARLYQLSLFRIFEQIWKYFSTIAIPNDDPFYELYEFGNHLLKQFFANFNSIGPPLICELLFWKGPSECYEIANGYGSYEYVLCLIYLFYFKYY